jgi:hypothetical protein
MPHAHQHHEGGKGESQPEHGLDRVTIAHDGRNATEAFGGA